LYRIPTGAHLCQLNENRIDELLEEKRRLHNQYLKEDSGRSRTALKNIKAKIQRETRAMKESWWCEKAEDMQEMADRHDSQGLFAALKVVYGPRSNAVAPVKSDDCTKLYTSLND